MNNLSWLLYFADVVYTQIAFLTPLAIAVPVVYAAWRLITLITSDPYSWESEITRKKKEKRQSEDFITDWRFIYIPLLVIFLVNFVPSKDTLYLIAGSEAGEYIVKTPEAQEILGDIKEIIQLQLEEMKK